MKAFLDHYGYRWMVHSPEGSMFRKQGVCIATAAGAGVKSTLKDMADSLFFWGVARIYQYGLGVAATDWNGKVTPGLKTKGMFYIMRMMQKNGWNSRDVEYWKEHGWTEKKRPWKL